jgi:hypothetical protein
LSNVALIAFTRPDARRLRRANMWVFVLQLHGPFVPVKFSQIRKTRTKKEKGDESGKAKI